jgi:hypothetical protein
MTNCLKGHRCGGRRRPVLRSLRRVEGHESLISPHLRFTIPDLRRPTRDHVNRISYTENFFRSCLCVSMANSAAIASRSGQIKVTCQKSNRNQADSNQKMWQRHLPFLKKSVPSCCFCGSNPAFKIKELPQEIKNTSKKLLRLFKVNKGFFGSCTL